MNDEVDKQTKKHNGRKKGTREREDSDISQTQQTQIESRTANGGEQWGEGGVQRRG